MLEFISIGKGPLCPSATQLVIASISQGDQDHSGMTDFQLSGDSTIGLTGGRQKYNARPQGNLLRGISSCYLGLQNSLLLLSQN